MNAECVCFNRVKVQGCLFRTWESEKGLKSRNSGVTLSYLNRNDETHWEYAIINKIIRYRLYDHIDAPEHWLLNVQWLEVIQPSSRDEYEPLKQVRYNSRYRSNQQPWTWLESISPHNIVYWPHPKHSSYMFAIEFQDV